MMDGIGLLTTPLGVLPLIPALAGVLPVILAAIGGAIVSMCKPSVLKAAMKVLWRNKFVVIALIAAGFGLFYLKGYCQERFGRGKGAVMQGQADWSAFRGGPDRRGTDLSGPDPVAGGTPSGHSRAKRKPSMRRRLWQAILSLFHRPSREFFRIRARSIV